MTTAIPTPLSLARPTAPLSPAAAEALAKLERAFAPQPEMSEADRRAHELASYVRRPVESKAVAA